VRSPASRIPWLPDDVACRSRARDRIRASRVEVHTSMHGPASTVPTDRPSSLTTEMPEIEELRDELARLRGRLAERDREAEQRELELRASYEATVRALADAVEARDAYTARHAERVAGYGLEIARACGLETEDGPDLEFGFLLHDIGKIAISDAILYKPGRLNEDERDAMRRHPVIGEEIVRGIDFLEGARQIVRSHHERWDGAGYPDRLAGEQIPLAARVFAVADTFDAVTSDRPYRAASSFGEARRVIAAAAGTQFDPVVADAFDDIADARFDEIRVALA
jgi:HD-GYP domain-containing protein (c-di-GMP phosphodiesterase class II)